MPRQPRYFLPDIPQHVIQRGVNRQQVFFDASDYRRYLHVLGKAARRYDCQIHAYVLMTNHTHLLITPGSKRSIPLVMQAMGRSYVQAINKKYERTGTLWEGRYRASPVQDDRYLLTCQKYIELNPVRACMVSCPGDYAFSSFAHNASGGPDELVTPHSLYATLGKTPEYRQAAYRRLFELPVTHDALATIRDAVNASQILGNDEFKDYLEEKLGRSVRPGKVGRPAKASR